MLRGETDGCGARKKGSSGTLRTVIDRLLLLASLAALPQQPAQTPAPARFDAQVGARDSAVPRGAPARAQDSIPLLVRRGRRAEAHYEMIARVRAPVAFGWGSSDPCDEIVGRFCLRFDPHERGEPPRPQPEVAIKARDEAIEALERAARVAPGDAFTARGLVRLLVEAHRDSAALRAAQRFAGAEPGTWGDLLLGFALHEAGNDTAAVSHFQAGMTRLSEKERKRLNIEALVSADEKASLRRLDAPARAGYEAALWKLADPLYLSPGNEALGEHLARYVWTRMLAELPTVIGMTTWGDDLEQLTFRYGVPTSRERIPAQGIEQRDGMLEHFDPASLAFLPESLLTVGVRATPQPGQPWSLDDPRAHEGYPPGAARLMQPMDVQVTRFPAGDSVVLRVDGALPLDSLHSILVGDPAQDSAETSAQATRGGHGGGAMAGPAGDRGRLAAALTAAARDSVAARAGLFVLPALAALLRGDTAVLRAVEAPASIGRDTASLGLALTLPPGRYVYSAELLESRGRLAGRARYVVELSAPAAGPTLSDVLIARPLRGALPASRTDTVLHALPLAAATPGDTVGLYAEAGRLAGGPGASYRVELALSRNGEPPPPVRFWSWLRQRFGGAPPLQGVALGWTAQIPQPPAARNGASAGAPAPSAILATDLMVPRVSPGLYTLRLRVIDAAGAATRSDRLLLIRPRPRPASR